MKYMTNLHKHVQVCSQLLEEPNHKPHHLLLPLPLPTHHLQSLRDNRLPTTTTITITTGPQVRTDQYQGGSQVEGSVECVAREMGIPQHTKYGLEIGQQKQLITLKTTIGILIT